jgi:regulator of replication initiation timing
MDIKEAKADHKKRQQEVVERINQLAAQQQKLAEEMRGMIEESHRLNGENRMLKRLNGEGDEKP